MLRSKSAQKQARAAEKRRLRNKSVRSLSKTNTTKAERLVFSGEIEPAKQGVAVAISSLDRGVGKGIIHPNNAARRKSRLVKKLNEALSASSAKAEPKQAG